MDHPILDAAHSQMKDFHRQFDGKNIPITDVSPFMQVKALLAVAEAINNLTTAISLKKLQ